MKSTSRVLSACLIAAFVASACGGGGEEPQETGAEETNNEAPSPSPSPTPTELLVEDFESTETAFELGTNGNAEISLEEGQLKLYSEDSEAESIAPLSAPADSLTYDVDVEMGLAQEALDAGTEDWFGIGCAAGEDVYFMLTDIYGSRYVISRKAGEYEQIGSDYSSDFEAEIGDTFHLTANCSSDGTVAEVSLEIDGEEVLSATDKKSPIGPFDGVAVFGQQDENKGKTAYSTFLFDNVEVAPQEE